MTFSPDDRMSAGTDGYGKIYLWTVAGGRLLATLAAENLHNASSSSAQNLDSLAFSPDSTALACGTATGIVRLWDAATGRSISAFSVNGSDPPVAAGPPVTTLVFSPGGRMLATAGSTEGTLGVRDVASGRNLAALTTVPGGGVASAAFTPGGTLLAATTSNNPVDHRIEIWSTSKTLAAMPLRS